MKNMMNQMIPLTIANTLDQSNKQRVEIASNQSIKQGVRAQNLAPKGNFDVYDQFGKVISNQNAGQFRDATVYVGVGKIAGGAGFSLDDDDDDGWDLDDDLPNKPAEFTLILPSGERQPIRPNDGELLIDAYYRVFGKPRDGSPMEIMDSDGNIVSSRIGSDMVGRAFRAHIGFIPGGALASFKRGRKATQLPFPAQVPAEIIEQTTAFTLPRGRLEMGGLLIGHIDAKGNNTVVCGFFPRQDEASSGYCEFHGSFTAIASAACDFANEKAGGDHTPDLRVIGWIHTHPDIGIFLSGIDINTFRSLRQVSFEQRCVAVVVDPIRKEHGVFTSEKRASGKHADKADCKIRLSEDLEARYHKFLNRMRTIQTKKGKEEIQFIMPGLLYQSRKAMGDVDDVLDAKMETLDQLVRRSEELEHSLMKKDAEINSLQADLHLLNVQQKQWENGENLMRKRLNILKDSFEEEKQSRLEASELVISLLAGQKEQQKILDSLQKQLTDGQQAAVEEKEELPEDEPHHRQIKVAVINEVESGNGKTVVKEESAQVFDPSDQVKPVEESTPRDEVQVNQDESPLDP
jgi:proteasome lid subunit RPN8/RPN11